MSRCVTAWCLAHSSTQSICGWCLTLIPPLRVPAAGISQSFLKSENLRLVSHTHSSTLSTCCWCLIIIPPLRAPAAGVTPIMAAAKKIALLSWIFLLFVLVMFILLWRIMEKRQNSNNITIYGTNKYISYRLGDGKHILNTLFPFFG